MVVYGCFLCDMSAGQHLVQMNVPDHSQRETGLASRVSTSDEACLYNGDILHYPITCKWVAPSDGHGHGLPGLRGELPVAGNGVGKSTRML